MPRWKMVRVSLEGAREGERIVEMEREAWNCRRRMSHVAWRGASVRFSEGREVLLRLYRSSGGAALQLLSPSHSRGCPLRDRKSVV